MSRCSRDGRGSKMSDRTRRSDAKLCARGNKTETKQFRNCFETVSKLFQNFHNCSDIVTKLFRFSFISSCAQFESEVANTIGADK